MLRSSQCHIIAIVALALLVVGVFGASLHWGFVWDDNHYLVDDPSYRGEVQDSDPVLQAFFVSRNYFRPLVVASLVAQLRLHGIQPYWFHLLNVASHLLCCLILYAILFRLWQAKSHSNGGYPWVLVVAALYAASPLVVEPVAWVSGRFDLFFGLFSLLVLYIYMFWANSVAGAVLLFCSYLLAALSKEHAIVVPVVAVLLAMMTSGDWSLAGMRAELLRRRSYVAVLVSAGIVYLLIRWGILGYLYVDESSQIEGRFSGWARLGIVLCAIGGYVVHALLPFYDVSPVYTLDLNAPLSDGLGLVQFVVGSSIVLFGLFGWMFPRQRSLHAVVLILLVSLLPVANILRLNGTDNYIALRFMYFPYAVFLICMFNLVMVVPLKMLRLTVVKSVLVIFVSVNGLVAASTVSVWESDTTLWSWGYAMRPDSFMVNSNLTANLVLRREFEKAIDVSQRYLKHNPSNLKVMQSLAMAYAGQGNHERALQIFEDLFTKFGVSSPKQLSQLYAGLAGVLVEANPSDPQAEAVAKTAIELYPNNRQAMYVLARILVVEPDKHDEAIELFKRALKLAPPIERSYMVEQLRRDPVGKYFAFTDREYLELAK